MLISFCAQRQRTICGCGFAADFDISFGLKQKVNRLGIFVDGWLCVDSQESRLGIVQSLTHVSLQKSIEIVSIIDIARFAAPQVSYFVGGSRVKSRYSQLAHAI